MLPFTKRTVRSEEDELASSGDRPIAHDARTSSFPPPRSDRPRVFTRSAVADDEMTTLLPRKGTTTLGGRPPTPVTPIPMPKLTSSRPPRAMLAEPPTRLFVLPSAPPPSISPVAGPPRSPSNRSSARPVAELEADPLPQTRKSDPPVNPPATVVTARTRIVTVRPAMSWAAALVAMGVFVGLATSVLARGDADTLIDATASLVDPSGGRAAAAGIEVSSVQTKAEERRTLLAETLDTLVPDVAVGDALVAAADPSPASPLPARAAPFAYVAHHAWHPAPAHAPAAHEVASSAASKPAAALKAAPPPKPAHASDEDVESASAADALAKAQLEASLR